MIRCVSVITKWWKILNNRLFYSNLRIYHCNNHLSILILMYGILLDYSARYWLRCFHVISCYNVGFAESPFGRIYVAFSKKKLSENFKRHVSWIISRVYISHLGCLQLLHHFVTNNHLDTWVVLFAISSCCSKF